MRPVIGIDLDRTLIYSTAALGLTMPDVYAPQLIVSEVFEGKPLSYMTDRAAVELRAMAESAVVVPVTTRTRTQFGRVRLPGVQSEYAITTNGAKLLVDDVPDHDWAATVRAQLTNSAPLTEITDHLFSAAAGPWVLKRRTCEHVFCYLVVNRAETPASFLEGLARWTAERGWTTSVQGRKVYCVPDGITKRAAMTEVVRRLGGDGYLAAGDSLLDADLLDGSRAGVRPNHGELAETGWSRPHVEVTESSGVLGGEEVVLRLAAMSAIAAR